VLWSTQLFLGTKQTSPLEALQKAFAKIPDSLASIPSQPTLNVLFQADTIKDSVQDGLDKQDSNSRFRPAKQRPSIMIGLVGANKSPPMAPCQLAAGDLIDRNRLPPCLMSLARFNLSKEAEDAINQQILVELSASYSYLSMSAWLSRDTIALHGLAEYFRKQSSEVPHAAATHTH